ncbi:MAG TPA: SRPBCC family protein [Planctomycetota bacterium]|nr:SRPBCC family protein [Planctomycetota bacterium]
MSTQDLSTVHHTFVVERSYPQSRARVFAALSTAASVRRWYVEGPKRKVESFEMDFRVGGAERSVLTYTGGTPMDGVTFVNEGHYLDIVSMERVVMASAMTAGERRISASLLTFELVDQGNGGTALVFTHQGVFFEGGDGPQMREAGWCTLLDRLAAHLAA